MLWRKKKGSSNSNYDVTFVKRVKLCHWKQFHPKVVTSWKTPPLLWDFHVFPRELSFVDTFSTRGRRLQHPKIAEIENNLSACSMAFEGRKWTPEKHRTRNKKKARHTDRLTVLWFFASFARQQYPKKKKKSKMQKSLLLLLSFQAELKTWRLHLLPRFGDKFHCCLSFEKLSTIFESARKALPFCFPTI